LKRKRTHLSTTQRKRLMLLYCQVGTIRSLVPLYKNTTSEDPDHVRGVYGLTMLIDAGQTYATNQSSKRMVRKGLAKQEDTSVNWPHADEENYSERQG